MEILSKLLVISLVFVNTLKNSDGGIIERIHERNKIRRDKLLPLIKLKNKFPQQNEYTDYDAGIDANYDDFPQNGYSEPSGIVNPDVIYNVPNNPDVEGYNGNIQNQQTNYKAGQISNSGQYDSNNFPVNKNIQRGTAGTSEDYNINSNIPRPLGSMDLINAGDVGKATDVEISNGVDAIADRFGEGSTSSVGEKEKKKVISEAKILKPLTKTKFFFQVQPVKPAVDRISGKNVVYYIE